MKHHEKWCISSPGRLGYVANVGGDPVIGRRHQRTTAGFAIKRDGEDTVLSMLCDGGDGEYVVRSDLPFAEYIPHWLDAVRGRRRTLKTVGPCRTVSCRPDGRPVHPDCCPQLFRRLAKTVDVIRIRGPHDLRPTGATLALTTGVHPKAACDHLCDSTIAITLDIYSDVVPGLDAEAVETVASQIVGTDNV